MCDGRLSIDDRRRLQALQERARTNRHDIAVLDARDMAELWMTARRQSGDSQTEAANELHSRLREWDIEPMWAVVRPSARAVASYTATATDVVLLTRLAADLRRNGSILARYQIREYGGKAYIILKGYPGLRRTLNASRYLASNTKVVEMGLGKLGAARAVTRGIHLTIFLTVAFRAIDTLMRDEATWHDLVGGLAGDLVKVGIAGGAAFLASAVVASGAAVSAVAVGPLFAAIAVGVLVGLALEYVDRRTGFTDALIQSLRDADRQVRSSARELERQWNWYHRNPVSTVRFWMRVFGAPF